MGGGGSGIGYAVAAHLSRAGHQVVVTGRRADALGEAARRLSEGTAAPVHPLAGDIADPGHPAAVADAEERYGPFDVLVLNAGGPPPGRVLEVTDEQWCDAFGLLVTGPLRLARLLLPGMARRGFGRVVFVTSTAVRQPQPDLATSVALRSAATAVAKLLSREFAANGVTVNCVAPGPIATDRRREILSARADATGEPPATLDAQDTATVPAGRPGLPEEVAAAVAFLASPQAAYINGTVLTVDGGRTETI
ncbi:SDR family oxidoreductase [Streptomyces sp. V3I8]|uniref:SDR family oxidoreductase n=1 Tax=Streptomyces sp. V3I8 TaxID=3042279 RepID=UPI0027D802C6|nr:SDR family oxidoreductase [Streptomyces sp. V3I8]